MAKRPTDGKSRSAGSVARPADDEALFEAAMRDVEALEPDGKAEPAPATRTPAPRPSRQPERIRALAPLAPGRSGDVDARTLERLRRGQLRPQARLDLHGMTQDDAHRSLAAFIARAQSEGRRCVIVITGKGRISEGGGVLRNSVPGWLNAPALRSRVLAFATAVPRDGGAGALYVLLRRTRPER